MRAFDPGSEIVWRDIVEPNREIGPGVAPCYFHAITEMLLQRFEQGPAP